MNILQGLRRGFLSPTSLSLGETDTSMNTWRLLLNGDFYISIN